MQLHMKYQNGLGYLLCYNAGNVIQGFHTHKVGLCQNIQGEYFYNLTAYLIKLVYYLK